MDFYIWLEQQKNRGDDVGELAQQFASDPVCPRWSNRLLTYRHYLVYRDAEEATEPALQSAFKEWKSYKKARTQPQQAAY